MVNRLMVGVGITFIWYTLQKRELNRFIKQRELENREQKAINKQEQITNVLDKQRDAILIVSFDQDLDVSDSQSLNIEFSNVKSEELFGINLADAMISEIKEEKDHALERLALPQFVPLDK